jgi:hypothetical protein
MPTPARPRVTAADRERRGLRIFARLQEGWSCEALAEAETLLRECIRQIVKASPGSARGRSECGFCSLASA